MDLVLLRRLGLGLGGRSSEGHDIVVGAEELVAVGAGGEGTGSADDVETAVGGEVDVTGGGGARVCAEDEFCESSNAILACRGSQVA